MSNKKYVAPTELEGDEKIGYYKDAAPDGANLILSY